MPTEIDVFSHKSRSVPEKPDALPDCKSGGVPSGNTITAQRGNLSRGVSNDDE
jgi:hypothetical protein